MDLVKLMAESAANFGGITVSISGDEKAASLAYDFRDIWAVMTGMAKTSADEEQVMVERFDWGMKRIAAAFGFKSSGRLDLKKASVSATFER